MSASQVIYFADWICLLGHFYFSVCCTNFNLLHFLLWSRIPWKIPIQFSLHPSLARLLSIQWSRCTVYMVVNSPLLSTTVLNPERCQWEHPVPTLQATKIFKLNKIVFSPDIITKMESRSSPTVFWWSFQLQKSWELLWDPVHYWEVN